MSHSAPGPSCRELVFGRTRQVAEAARPALEDYARALTGALDAELLLQDGEVAGVHVCGAAPGSGALADLESFARDLAEAAPSRLGWS